MVCSKCNSSVNKEAKFCSECGHSIVSDSTITDSAITDNEVIASENIRQELKQYKVHSHLICLECGYEGLMGIGKKVIPWIIRVPLFLVIVVLVAILWILFGIWGLIFGILIFLPINNYLSRSYIHCPNCKEKLLRRKLE